MEFFRSVQFRVWDLIDIAIVSAIIYRLLLLIKGTRAAQMLIGLGILLIASVVSGYFDLYTLDWIIQSFWAQIVLAVIILFQPEIRRALAQMGESRIFPSLPSSLEGFRSVEDIIRSAVALANRRIGALLVIERETSLTDLIEIGVPMDARLTKELMLSVFHTTSPIHDGAVIIRGNRVVAAGCFLPISITSDLSKSLGTRHRAAVGLTEETDALVVVVSEETGEMSLCEAGRLERGLDMSGLRERLGSILLEKREGKKR